MNEGDLQCDGWFSLSATEHDAVAKHIYKMIDAAVDNSREDIKGIPQTEPAQLQRPQEAHDHGRVEPQPDSAAALSVTGLIPEELWGTADPSESPLPTAYPEPTTHPKQARAKVLDELQQHAARTDSTLPVTSDDDIFHDAESFLKAVNSWKPMGLPYRSRIYDTCEAIRSVHSVIEAAPESPDTVPIVPTVTPEVLIEAPTYVSVLQRMKEEAAAGSPWDKQTRELEANDCLVGSPRMDLEIINYFAQMDTPEDLD